MDAFGNFAWFEKKLVWVKKNCRLEKGVPPKKYTLKSTETKS